jgi:hypothetical protein
MATRRDAGEPQQGARSAKVRTADRLDGALRKGDARMDIEPGIYEHFKGQRYEVLGTARHSETEEVFVSYRKLYDDYSYWVRPVEMFVGNVERDGYAGPRFRRVT